MGTTASLSASVTGGVWTSSAATIASIDTAGNLTALAAGVTTIGYTITSSLGCSATASRADTVFGIVTGLSITAPARICAGSTITLSGSTAGGSWAISDAAIASVTATSGTLIAVAPGTAVITYTVGAAGCSATATTNITIDSLPATPVITGVASLCAGTATTFSGSPAGGVWSVSDTALAAVTSAGILTARSAGTVTLSYTIVNAAGCTATATTTVAQLAGPTATLSHTGTVAICHGVPVNLSITPATFASIQWLRNGVAIPGATSGTYTADTIGFYTVTIANGGCATTITGVNVIQTARPVITRGTGNLLYTGSFTTYQWLLNGTVIPGATSSVYTFTTSGAYRVIVTNAAGCTDTSNAYLATSGGGSAVEQVQAANISLYPNPATNAIFIDAPFPVMAALYAADGRCVYHANTTTSINVENLANGMYMVVLYNNDGTYIKTEKFIKE